MSHECCDLIQLFCTQVSIKKLPFQAAITLFVCSLYVAVCQKPRAFCVISVLWNVRLKPVHTTVFNSCRERETVRLILMTDRQTDRNHLHTTIINICSAIVLFILFIHILNEFFYLGKTLKHIQRMFWGKSFNRDKC